MSVVDFHAERARLRPWADYGIATLRTLAAMHRLNGNAQLLRECTDEIARREAADKRYGPHEISSYRLD